MEVFNNQQRPSYDEVVSYGPKWWTEYREMDANYKFAGWTLDLMAHWLERIVNNQFPAHADEEAISMFEKVLKIEPEPGENLEERRRTVAAYYSGTGKLSKSVIQSIVKSYTGCESDLWWAAQTLHIRIFLNEETDFSVRKTYSIISRRFPAHLAFLIREVLCVFELSEQMRFDKTRYRLCFALHDKVLDGKYALDGSLLLTGELPPFFAYKLPFKIENGLKTENTAFEFSFVSKNEISACMRPVHRVLLNWWEELRTLDGVEKLDGTFDMDQKVPPNFDTSSYKMELQNEEQFVMRMYVPAKAKKLEGTVNLDGTILLNSGKEEL